MNDKVTIHSDALTALIDPLGAELVSLKDGTGEEWMTDADPQFWTGHAPILFPIVGELAGGTYRLGDKAYAMQRHGFARKRVFAVAERDAGHVRFRLVDDEETRAQYPFSFTLDLDYWLEDSTLTEIVTVTNTGDADMPFSMGFHPGFAWPLPGGGEKTEHRIIFAEPETGPIRRLDANGLLCAFEDTPVKNRTLRPFGGMFHADALIWDRLESRSLRFEGQREEPEDEQGEVPSPAAIDLSFPDNDLLGIWQKPGANYLCLEPWSGIADPEGFDGDFTEKPGIMILPAGEARSFTMAITIHPAGAEQAS